MARQALDDVVVLDLSGSVATAYCGHLCAALGARVIDLEPPRTGHATRRIAPFVAGAEPPESSAFHAWVAARKESVAVDPRTEEGRRTILDLCAGADVLLEAFRPGELEAMGLGAAALLERNPALVVLSLSWFGQDGPLARAPGGDPLVASLVGMVRGVGPIEGPPLPPAGPTSQIVAGASAFIGALGHLIGRARGRIGGAWIDASVLDANLCLTDAGTVGVFNGCAVPPRLGVNRIWPTYPAGIYRAKDGWVGVTAVLGSQWRALCDLLELPELGAEPRYQITVERMADADLLDRALAPALARRTAAEWFHEGQAARVPIAMVPDAAELLACEQFAGRGAFAAYALPGRQAAGSARAGEPAPPVREGASADPGVEPSAEPKPSPAGATFRAPGLPFRLTATPARAGGSAPRLGEHDGLTLPRRVVKRSPSRSSAPASAGATSSFAAGNPRRRPSLLAGIRVVDLTMGWAGPLASRHLADLGAEVIKVESCARFDWWRGWDATPEGLRNRVHEKSSAFNMVNRNKLGVTLDLKSPRGIELVERLVALSDAVVDNYASTVLPKLGLGWEALSAVNPSLVMLSMPPFGATGPWRGYRAYGSTVEHASGLPHLQNEESAPPTMQHVALGDPVAGIYGAIALLAALRHRERTGEGQRVDLSHVEALFAQGVVGFLEREIAGRAAPRLGRRHREHAPHGVYRCAGTDQWITITILEDAQWRALGDLMAAGLQPLSWAKEDRFATSVRRKAQEDEIDARLGDWTLLRDRDLLAAKLLSLGVPAAPVYDVGEPLHAPQLVARGFWQWLEREHVGLQPHPSPPWRPVGAPPYGIDWPAPTLGQHNDDVLRGVLGLGDDELEALREEGVIGCEPELPAV